jgi:SAM-dependent methyltransferase
MAESPYVLSSWGPIGDDDALEVRPPGSCSEDDVRRWNREWLDYLGREWESQLRHHSEYPDRPPLPEEALALRRLSFGRGGPLDMYCHREWLLGRRVMELGCGCGNAGKLIASYVDRYLGVDYSPLALQIARLVSPSNCAYVQVADHQALRPFRGAIDTVVSRHFWIHQNLTLARHNLEYLEPFLRPGGRLYADFYWPDPERQQGVVFTPDHALSKAYPSATFRYTEADVARWLAGRPFRLLGQEVTLEAQRRYVVLERL